MLEYFDTKFAFGTEMNFPVGESYAGRCKRIGCITRAYLLKYQDDEDVQKMVNEQVQLLNGNRDLYIMIDNNMKNGDLNKFFIKEHNIIFSWREEFFNHHFPNGSWFTVHSTPFDPEDVILRFITISFQITKYFDRMMHGCTKFTYSLMGGGGKKLGPRLK